MIKMNDKQVTLNYFPDGTFLLKEKAPKEPVTITWLFEKNQELLQWVKCSFCGLVMSRAT